MKFVKESGFKCQCGHNLSEYQNKSDRTYKVCCDHCDVMGATLSNYHCALIDALSQSVNTYKRDK